MRVAILSSGGKDSSAAIWWAQCQGWEVTHLVTVMITGDDSLTFQIPGTKLAKYQAHLVDCEWLPVLSSGLEQQEMKDLEVALSNLDIDGVVTGALRSDYQKNRIEITCENKFNISDIINELNKNSVSVLNIINKRNQLEELFMELTNAGVSNDS